MFEKWLVDNGGSAKHLQKFQLLQTEFKQLREVTNGITNDDSNSLFGFMFVAVVAVPLIAWYLWGM